jgi:hypothetical protein
MADISGIRVESVKYGGVTPVRAATVARSLSQGIATDTAVRTGASQNEAIDRPEGVFTAFRAHDYVEDQILGRIWFSPDTIDAGFITDDTPTDVWIWNAYRDRILTVSNVTPADHDGVAFPVKLPARIPSMQERKWTLTVTEKGPAVMDMVFSLVIDGANYPIHITAMRVILMALEPDWSDGISFKLSFDTIIATGRTLKEQRRPLVPVPARELSVSYVVEGIEDQILLNRISWCHDKMVGVPVYHEPVYVTDVTEGDTVLTAVMDIAGFVNLNRLSRYVILINRTTGLYGLYAVEDIEGGAITLTKPVTLSYPASDTVVYPVMFALVGVAEFDVLTPKAKQARITWKELDYGE